MVHVKGKGKGMVLYSAVSSPLDRSKRFTLSSPGRPVQSDTVLGFSWKHSMVHTLNELKPGVKAPRWISNGTDRPFDPVPALYSSSTTRQ